MMMEKIFSRQVIELALPKIKEFYGDITVEELESLSYEHYPIEVRNSLDEAQAQYNLENKIYKVSDGTTSSDGKTCNFCKKELVVKKIQRINGTSTVEETVLSCPNPKGGVACEIDSKKNQFKTKLAEDIKKMEHVELTYTMKTRYMDINKARHIYDINKNERLVTAPNEQFTEIKFALEPIIENEKLKGESKSLQSAIVCKHELERNVDLDKATLKASVKDQEGESIFYHLIKVEKIGRIGLTDTYRCNHCRAITEDLNYERITQEQYQKRVDEVIHYKVSFQRIDSVIEKDILRILYNARMNCDSRFFKSASIEEALRKTCFTWIVGFSIKKFIDQRLKKLANDGILEVEGRAWSFGTYMDGSWNQYGIKYLDDATKLNHYRYFDPHAKFLIKSIFQQLKKMREDERSYGTTETSRKNRKDFFKKIASQFELQGNEITIGKTDGQVSLFSKVKRN